MLYDHVSEFRHCSERAKIIWRAKLNIFHDAVISTDGLQARGLVTMQDVDLHVDLVSPPKLLND